MHFITFPFLEGVAKIDKQMNQNQTIRKEPQCSHRDIFQQSFSGVETEGKKVSDTCLVPGVSGLKAHAASPVIALLCPEPRLWVNGCDVHG